MAARCHAGSISLFTTVPAHEKKKKEKIGEKNPNVSVCFFKRRHGDIVIVPPYTTGDDPEECLLSPMGTVKKVLGLPTDEGDCAF